ncbi:MAG TPA: hypothetical protein VLF17_00255 [Candidatus Nitrosotenuis sp.]|nr:hypothetical protein [Candidatus Nitrosotenuis sp.]
MLGLDGMLVHAIMQTVKKEIRAKDFEGIEHQLQDHGMQVTDMFYRFSEIKESLLQFTDELKTIEDKILRNFLTVEQGPTLEIWLAIKNQFMAELILKSFADEEKKAIIDLIRDTPETIPRILERCGIPNTSGYRKMNQLIDEKIVVSAGMAESFEGKRAILYRAVIQKLQILINGNKITVKILVDQKTRDSSEIIRAIAEINQRKAKTAAN